LHRYAKAKLQEVVDEANFKANEATTRKTEYEAAAQAAEEGDEENFFSSQLRDAEEREKRANEAKAVADANRKEKESAVAAAKAAAAVAEAGDDVDQAIATAKEAAEEAQAAATAASITAEAALEEARAAKTAADAARAAMADRGAAATAGLTAVNTENHAFSTAHALEMEAYKLQKTSEDFGRIAVEKKMKLDGDTAVLNRGKHAASIAKSWHNITINERDAAQKALDDLQAHIQVLKQEWEAAQTAEQDALAALPIAKKDMDQASAILGQTEAALEKVVASRRKAWKSAYKTETANNHLTAAATKIARIATEEKEIATKKQQKAQRGLKATNVMLLDKETKYSRAVKLVEESKDSGDMDAVATSERAAEAAKAAKEAAAAAKSAAETAFDVVAAQCAKKLETIEALDKSVQGMGDADESVVAAMKLGKQANEMMDSATAATKKVKALLTDATKEHTYRAKDLVSKTTNRKRLDLLIRDALVEEQRKIRYLDRAKETEIDWKAKSAEVSDYVLVVKAAYTATKESYDKAVLEANDNEAAAQEVRKKESTARKEITTNAANVKSLASLAGTDMLAKLMSSRSKWAQVAATEWKKRRSSWDIAVENALPLLISATKDEAAATRVYEKLAAQQDNLEAAAVGPRNRMKITLVQKQEEETKLKKEQSALNAQLASVQRQQKHWQNELERLEKLRRETALEALTMRVESIWKKRSKLHDPDNKRRLEKSVYVKITAAWDRDGTPLGPGKLDTWYLDASKITFAHENMPGYLKEGVISRCSSACSEYADLQCNEGRVSRSCTRGRVYRARYKRTGTIEAENDWFICRCNTGVMQFAGRETLDVLRQKNKLLQASITPEQITFDVRLHAEEMMPDRHVHCFRDFEDWLTKKTDFAQPDPEKFKDLDALALSKPEEAVNTYNTIKKLWYKQCLKEAVPSPSTDTHPGSTDSSLDIFDMKNQPHTILDAKLHKDRSESNDGNVAV
jgi:hypothetical protein